MGLDIRLWSNNYEEFQLELLDTDSQRGHLSRTFCNFLLRDNSLDDPSGKTELVQIGQLTGVEVGPLEQLLTYPDPDGLDFRLRTAESEAERQTWLARAAADKAALAGNLATVLATVNQLLKRLPTINNLPARLNPYGYTPLDYDSYFTDFATDKGNGYIGNNFGQDLRNLRWQLEYAGAHGSHNAWFSFG